MSIKNIKLNNWKIVITKNKPISISNALIIFILLFYSCNFKNGEKGNEIKSIEVASSNTIIQTNPLDYLVIGDSIITKINEGAPLLSYKFNIDSTGYLLKSIIIYSDNIKVQEIIANKRIWEKKFQLIDWDFDGYKDITVLDNCGSGGCSYWIWNYSQKNGKYYYNTILSEWLGLEIDTTSKYIINHYRAGTSEEFWDTLQYVNNELNFIKGLYRERYNDSVGNFWVKNTHRKRVNNKLVTTIDSLIIKNK